MHGKVQHSELFKHFRLDLKALRVWVGLKERSGEALLKALARELQKSGVTVLDGRTFMEKALIPKGWLTKARPKSLTPETIRFGLKQARQLAQAGIGQTIVVKGNAVASVEAMEGSDEAIRRAGRWAGPGTVVFKAASPRQDWRFDIPTLGPRTIRGLIQSKAQGIVVEGSKTFLLNRRQTLELADQKGIFVLAV